MEQLRQALALEQEKCAHLQLRVEDLVELAAGYDMRARGAARELEHERREHSRTRGKLAAQAWPKTRQRIARLLWSLRAELRAVRAALKADPEAREEMRSARHRERTVRHLAPALVGGGHHG